MGLSTKYVRIVLVCKYALLPYTVITKRNTRFWVASNYFFFKFSSKTPVCGYKTIYLSHENPFHKSKVLKVEIMDWILHGVF